MIATIRSNLSSFSCASAVEKSESLFNSRYVTNEIRMLHASSYGCLAGVQLIPLMTAVGSGDYTVVAGVPPTTKFFNSMAQIFPSSAIVDAKTQSLQKMQDVLQSMIVPGTVLSDFDSNIINLYNTGSLLYRDRTDDANTLLMFSSMALFGTLLSRYGDPDPSSYDQRKKILDTWSNETAIANDVTKNACSFASSVLNMYDGVSVVSTVSSGALGTALLAMQAALDTIISAGMQKCRNGQVGIGDGDDDPTNDRYGETRCNNAKSRLRYRNACHETDRDPQPVRTFVHGMMIAIDGTWAGVP